MHRYLIACSLVLLVLKTKAQDSTLYTLKQCIDLALQNNLDVKLSEFQAEITGTRLTQARANALPYASAYANQGINRGKSINPYTNTFVNQEIVTGQYGVNAGLTLFNGFNLVNTMRQYYFSNEAGKMDLEQARMDITINVMLAYLQVLSSRELLGQSASQVAVSRAQVERLKVLEANGAVAPSVIYDTRGQLANDQLTFINAKAGFATSKNSLERLVNVSFAANAKFESVNINGDLKPYDASAETVFSQASAALPLVKSAEYKRLSAEKNIYALRGQQFPSLSLVGSLGTNYSDAALAQKIIGVSPRNSGGYVTLNNEQVPVFVPDYQYSNTRISFKDQFKNNLNSYVGLSLQVPVFSGLKTRTQISLAKINGQQAEVQKTTTNTRLKNNVNQAYTDMTASFERYQVLQQQVSDYSESFKIATVKFEKGAITTVDYVIAKNNNDRANMNLIAARYDYILKSKVLDYFMGKPGI